MLGMLFQKIGETFLDFSGEAANYRGLIVVISIVMFVLAAYAISASDHSKKVVSSKEKGSKKKKQKNADKTEEHSSKDKSSKQRSRKQPNHKNEKKDEKRRTSKEAVISALVMDRNEYKNYVFNQTSNDKREAEIVVSDSELEVKPDATKEEEETSREVTTTNDTEGLSSEEVTNDETIDVAELDDSNKNSLEILYDDDNLNRLIFNNDNSAELDIHKVIVNGNVQNFDDAYEIRFREGDKVYVDFGIQLVVPDGWKIDLLVNQEKLKTHGLILSEEPRFESDHNVSCLCIATSALSYLGKNTKLLQIKLKGGV